ncbi:MAG: glycosyltransferase, partial [Lachnospiraceae bacterium]|nr:glycosyltransferase [Lachnospiraceae bacterium]
RTETLWKCLDSLKPLMDAVPSELVIVDTGCDEETNRRMHTYTDQIYPFTWINDFAAARNCGLEKCSGDWFLYIDDDEWFTDVTEIVDFFTSGDYQNYSAACYIQRNYSERSGKQYTDYFVRRIFSLETKPRFMSKIHEYVRVPNRDKLLHSPVDHYGYIYDTAEEHYAHSLRNIKPLEEMIEENPKDFHSYIQLLQEYEGISNFAAALPMSRQLISNLKGMEQKSGYRAVYSYGRYMEFLSLLKQFRDDDAVRCADDVFRDRTVSDVARAMIHHQLAFRYWEAKKDDVSTAKHALAYREIYDKRHDDEKYIADEGLMTLHNTFIPMKADPVTCIGILASLRLGDTAPMKQYLKTLGWDGKLILCVDFESQFLEAIAGLPFEESFCEAIRLMCESVIARQRIFAYIGTLQDFDAPAYRSLARIFADLKGKEPLLLCMKIVHAAEGASPESDALLTTLFAQLIELTTNFMDLPLAIWQIAKDRDIDFSPALTALDYTRFMQAVNRFIATSYKKCSAEDVSETDRAKILDDAAFVAELFLSRLPEDSNRWLYLQASYARFMIRQCYAQVPYQELHDLLSSCVRLTGALYDPYYTDQARSDEMEMLPLDYRFALHLKALLDAEAAGDAQTLKSSIEAAASVIPQLKDAILHYATLITEQLKAEAAPASSSQITEDMEALRKQLLEKAAQLRAAGMTDAADQILSQLEKF